MNGLIVLIVIAVIFLNFFIAKEFYLIAEIKGFAYQKYFWYCFLLGWVGYLIVVALPTKNVNNINDELPEI